MSNIYVRFQSLLGKEPVTRGQVTIIHPDNTMSIKLSNNNILRLRTTGFIVGDFVYLKGDTVTGIAPSLAIIEVII